MMKKILIFVLSILCLFSFVMASACDKDDKNAQTTDNVLINGFNSWDDMIIFDLNPTAFIGNWEINTDKDYIVEGASSYKIYVQSTRANQPNFKMAAKNVKTDITDVEKFGLYIYNCEEYEFEVIITAFAADTVVCAPIATVKSGANNLMFDINRAIIQQTGKVVTDYSISFSGIKSDTTIYIDNLHVKTTTAPVVIKGEIQEVIDGINALSNQPERAEIEAVLDKYNALSAEDKLCVTNSTRLKAAIQPFWLSDLAAAQTQDPDTLLYFDMPFAEIQVDGATDGISSYNYSTEQKYGEEQGSLKVNFSTSSTNWVTLSTSATTLIEEGYIEFYVYNDSDQAKAMCVGWNATLDPVLEDYFYVIEPRVWTKIYCESDWLTNAGGASGGFQICGLQSRTEGGSCAPRDAMYFSSVIKRDDGMAIAKARKGEDANTLYFFDRELGLSQVTSNHTEFEISTEVKHGTDAGSLAIKIDNFGGNPSITWNTFEYDFKDGDYVVFYAYNDTASDIIDISLNTTHRERLHKGTWAMVIWKGSDVVANDWSWLIGYNYSAEDYGPATGTSTVDGTVYISKVKVYSKEQVVDLSAVEDTYEYTVGHTTLIGKADMSQDGGYHPNEAAFNDSNFTHAYYVNGLLRYHGRPSSGDKEYSPMAGFVFKDAYDAENCYLYITVKGAVEGQVFAQVFNEDGITGSGHMGTPSGTLVETLSNGYSVFKIHIGAYASDFGDSGFKAFRLAVRKIKRPYINEVTISDIEVKYETNA